jgi:hypothetical protein
VVKLKREIKAPEGSVIFLFGLTITKGPVGMPMANAYGKITGFVKEPNLLGPPYPPQTGTADVDSFSIN